MKEEESGLDVEAVQRSFKLSPGYVCPVNSYTYQLEVPALLLRMSEL